MEEAKAILKELPGRIATASAKERRNVFKDLYKVINNGKSNNAIFKIYLNVHCLYMCANMSKPSYMAHFLYISMPYFVSEPLCRLID